MGKCDFCDSDSTRSAELDTTAGIFTTREMRTVELCDSCFYASKNPSWVRAKEKELKNDYEELAGLINNSGGRQPMLDAHGGAAARFRAKQGVQAAGTAQTPPGSGPLAGECEFCGTGYHAGDKKCGSCGAKLPVTVPGKLSKKETEQLEAERKAAAEAEEKRKAEAAAKRAARRKLALKIAVPCIAAAILAVAGVLIGLAAAKAQAEKGLFYEEYGLGYAVVRAGDKYSEAHVNIPAEYKGAPVLKIGEGAFKDKEYIKCVTVPPSVGEIVSGAFSGCPQLKAIYINESCQNIGLGAFEDSPQVTVYYSGSQAAWNEIIGAALLNPLANAGRLKVNIAAMDFTANLFFVKYAGRDAFAAGANSLFDAQTLTLPSSFGGKTVLGILNEGFENTSLKEVTIPDTVDWIHEEAFKGCAGLETISLPGSVTILEDAFDGCASLKKIYIRCRPEDDNVLYYPEGNGYFAAAQEEYIY